MAALLELTEDEWLYIKSLNDEQLNQLCELAASEEGIEHLKDTMLASAARGFDVSSVQSFAIGLQYEKEQRQSIAS
jgi:hypothetical protein